jgi:hypothetical protein
VKAGGVTTLNLLRLHHLIRQPNSKRQQPKYHNGGDQIEPHPNSVLIFVFAVPLMMVSGPE